MMKYWWFACILCLACSPQPKDIAGFDEQAFASDANGCRGERLRQKEQLFDASQQLKGLSEDEVAATLGKPDVHDLADRSQQFFIYYIEPSAKCDSTSGSKPPLTMYIRFSALGIATEVNFQNY